MKWWGHTVDRVMRDRRFVVLYLVLILEPLFSRRSRRDLGGHGAHGSTRTCKQIQSCLGAPTFRSFEMGLQCKSECLPDASKEPFKEREVFRLQCFGRELRQNRLSDAVVVEAASLQQRNSFLFQPLIDALNPARMRA